MAAWWTGKAGRTDSVAESEVPCGLLTQPGDGADFRFTCAALEAGVLHHHASLPGQAELRAAQSFLCGPQRLQNDLG